jgi:ubiquinone biosynthesis protein
MRARAFFSRLARLPGLAGRISRVCTVMICYATALGAGVVVDRLRRPVPSRRGGERWTRLLIALGPSYIKIGQLLSTRRDLLPESVCTALGRLTDAAPPPRRSRLERAVRHAYRDRAWPFAEFEWTPAACGSIATVHRAVTTDGRDVAVKVRRPGIDRMMRRDFELTALAMGLLGKLPLPHLRSMPFKAMHAQVGAAILRQLDFAAERRSLEALRANLVDFERVRLPESIPELCTDTTVVMEYIDDLTRFAPTDLAPETRRDAARILLAAIYEMLFVHGLVHCDMHPGNLYLDRTAQLVVLDAGFVIKLPEKVRVSFADFFINMAMGNGRMCGQIVIESADQLARDCDLDGFRDDLAKLVEASAGARSGEFSLAHFAGRLFALQREYGIYPTPEFAFPLLSMLVIEGMIKGFDSEVDFQAEAMPVLRRRNTPRAGTVVR